MQRINQLFTKPVSSKNLFVSKKKIKIKQNKQIKRLYICANMELDTDFPQLNPITRTLAKLVYANLKNDERLSNIQPQFESSLNVFYLSAESKQNPQVAFVPLSHSRDMDFGLVRALQQKLESTKIYIAIVDSTGSILHYQIEEGLH